MATECLQAFVAVQFPNLDVSDRIDQGNIGTVTLDGDVMSCCTERSRRRVDRMQLLLPDSHGSVPARGDSSAIGCRRDGLNQVIIGDIAHL